MVIIKKYLCLKCGESRIKKPDEKTYKKRISNGEIIKVPACCDRKMEVME